MTSPAQRPEIKDSIDELGKIDGILSADDEDAYKYKILDTGGITGLAYLEPHASTIATNAQLCMFLECAEAESGDDPVDIQSCGSAVQVDYSDRIRGCCGQLIDIDFECPGGDDSVQAYVRIRSTAPQCEAYSISTGQ